MRYILFLFFMLFAAYIVTPETSAQSTFFLTSSKQTVRELRETVAITWDSTAIGADYCEASGFWKGRREVTGVEVVRPWIDGNYYALKCFPRDQSKKPVSLSVTINVDKDVLPEYGGFPAIDFTATPSSIEEGGDTILAWNAKGADFCYGYHGATFASGETIQDEWSDARGLDPIGSMIIHPRSSGRYQISCNQLTKTTNYSNSADVYVTIGPKKPTISLTISKQILERGDAVDVSWLAPKAESCYGLAYVPNEDGYFVKVDFTSPWNSTSLSSQGSMRVIPAVSTQYYIHCMWKNEKGESTSQQAASKVNVTQQGSDTTPKQAPFRSPTILSFSAEPHTVKAGESVVVYWNAKDAERCSFITDTHSGLSTEDTHKKFASSGSASFIPLKSGRYGISCVAATYTRGELGLEYATQAYDEESADIAIVTPQEVQKKQEASAKKISISFTTNHEVVPKGQTALLEWNAPNATYCMPKGPKWWKGTRPTKGSFEIKPEYTATYQLECINDAVKPVIKKSSSLAIEVVPIQSPSWLMGNTNQKPVISLNANKTDIAKKEKVIFSWTASYAEICRGEGGASAWQGKKKTSGSHTLYPQFDYDITTPYRLVCSNRNGTTVSNEIKLSFKKTNKGKK